MDKKNMIRAFFILAVFQLTQIPSWSETGLTVTKNLDVDEAVRLAYLNNPSLLSSLEDIAIAQQRLKIARHLLYPQLGFDATAVTFERERDFALTEGIGGTVIGAGDGHKLLLGRGTLEQTLYSGGRNKNAIALARASLEQAEISRNKIQRQILRDVQLSFIDYLLAQEKEAAFKDSSSILASLKSQAADSAMSQLLWEDQRWGMELEQDKLHAQEMPQRRTNLLRAIGMDLFSEIQVQGNLERMRFKKVPALTTALSWARELRPEYRSQALLSEMDATQVAIALAGRNPIISVAGTYEVLGKEFPLRTENWAGLVRMHLPLSWDSWNTIRERRAQRRKGQVLRVDIEDQIASEVRRAHASLSYQMARLDKEKQRLERWQALYAGALRQARSGFERVELARRYAEVRMSWLAAQADALKSMYELEHAVGRNLEE